MNTLNFYFGTRNAHFLFNPSLNLAKFFFFFLFVLWSLSGASQAPPAGFDLANSEGSLTISGITVQLTGPTIIERGEPMINAQGLIEIPVEMKAMCLEGAAPGLGNVRVQAGTNYGLPPTTGFIRQMNAGPNFFPAESQFEVIPKVEIETMGSFCIDDMITLEASPPLSEIPPFGSSTYVPPGGLSVPVTITDCCTGLTTVMLIHVSHELISPDPPVPNITLHTSTITISNNAGNAGNVELNIVTPGDCGSVVVASGAVNVASGQSSSQTASDLSNALNAALAAKPQCDIDVSVSGSVITTVSRLLSPIDCCLNGTDLSGSGVVLGTNTNLGQQFVKFGSTVSVPDLRCSIEFIPTLTEWGLIIFAILGLIIGILFIRRMV